MDDKTIKLLLSGILVCLLVIAFKVGKPPVVNNIPSSGSQTMYLQDNNYNYQVIPLSEEKIAVLPAHQSEIKIFEYNKEKAMYILVGYFNPTNPSTYDIAPAK